MLMLTVTAFWMTCVSDASRFVSSPVLLLSKNPISCLSMDAKSCVCNRDRIRESLRQNSPALTTYNIVTEDIGYSFNILKLLTRVDFTDLFSIM